MTTFRNPRVRYDQLKRALAEMREARARDPKLLNDFKAQGDLVLYLKDCWPLIGEDEKRLLLNEVSNQLYRTISDEPAIPAALLTKIIQLDSDEDIRRAIQARNFANRDYIWAPEEFIYKAVGGWLGMYLDWCKNNYAPLGFHFWAGVTALGAVCKRDIYFDAGQYFIWPNWYTFLVGDSATGKSHAAGAAVEIIRRLNNDICPSENEFERLQHGLELINLISVSDATIPGITKYLTSLRHNPHPAPNTNPESGEARSKAPDVPVPATAFLHIDELSTFLGKKTYDVEQRAAWLAAVKEGDEIEKLTSGEGLQSLRSPNISVLACCAPGWMKETISPTILEGGLADRTNYIFRDPVPARKNSPSYSPFNLSKRDPVVAERLAAHLHEIIRLPHKQMPAATPEAERIGTKLYVQLAEAEDLRLRSANVIKGAVMSSGRAFNDITRLALILAVSEALVGPDWPTIPLTPDHISLAQRLLEVEQRGMENFIMAANRKSPEAVEVHLHRALLKLSGCTRRSDFIRGPMKGYKVADILPHLRQFMEEELVEVVREGRVEKWRPANHTCPACVKGVKLMPYELRKV